MRFGIDRLVDQNFVILKDQRVGLFSNLAAVNQRLQPTLTILHDADAVNLVAIFSPEHGFGASAADGHAVASGVDPATGVPIYSLYGAHYKPTPDMLREVDVIVCDIQDIGVRYYTYLWTLSYIMEACGEAGVQIIILDRPNPLGARMDGGTLDPAVASLVGRFPIPIQHGMTLGELARMCNTLWNPTPAEVHVIRCEGWQRQQMWEALRRPFVPPSPNMPHFSTALHYPGACLVEGTTLSEGRGTALPFEVVGAPYIDALALADAIQAEHLPGVVARPHAFTPHASKYAGETCYGVQLHINDPEGYQPLLAWLTIIHLIRQQYPDDFGWQPEHFDRLIGNTTTRPILDSGGSLGKIIREWTGFHREFAKQRQSFLLYDLPVRHAQ